MAERRGNKGVWFSDAKVLGENPFGITRKRGVKYTSSGVGKNCPFCLLITHDFSEAVQDRDKVTLDGE